MGAAQEVNRKPVKRHWKARLKVWTPEIQDALRAKKQAFFEWKQNNKPNQKDNSLVINKKLTTGHLRKLCRMNPGRFGPIPVRSGRFGPSRFGPISGVSRFGPVGAGRFGPIS